MKIEVELNGVLSSINKHQLFTLAKRGDVSPDTRVVVDGVETTAKKIKSIEFKEPDGIYRTDVNFPSYQESIPVPHETKEVNLRTARNIERSSETFTIAERIFLDYNFKEFWTTSYIQRFWFFFVLFNYIAFIAATVAIFSGFTPIEENSSRIGTLLAVMLALLVDIMIARIFCEVILVFFRISEQLRAIIYKIQDVDDKISAEK